LDWIIIGGESGPGSRPSDRRWFYDVIGDCKAAGVAAFIKQLGTKSQFDSGPLLRLKDRKGGSPEEWPEDLRVRQFPRIR
jgi:protein gp37